MRLTLSKFSPEDMKPYRTILLIGRRGTGKSTLLEDLLHGMRKRVDFGLFFTPTQDSREMFERHAPSSWVHDAFDPDKIERLCASQRAAGDKRRDVLLVLDDMMADKRVLKSTAIRDIFFNGRHQHITYISSQQYVLDMPPDLRTNIDYVFVLKDNILANKQRLHKYFFGMFNSFQDFATVMDTVTTDYGCLVLDNTCRTNELSEMLSWYRASPHPRAFKLGKPVFWKLHEQTVKSRETVEMEREDEARLKALDEQRRARVDRITSVRKQDDEGNEVDAHIQLA